MPKHIIADASAAMRRAAQRSPTSCNSSRLCMQQQIDFLLLFGGFLMWNRLLQQGKPPFLPKTTPVSCRNTLLLVQSDLPWAAAMSQAQRQLVPALGAEDSLFFCFSSQGKPLLLSTATVLLFSSERPVIVSLLWATHDVCEWAVWRTWKHM